VQLAFAFRLAGAAELTFSKGDRVRGDHRRHHDAGDRSLMLIVAGHVAVFPESR